LLGLLYNYMNYQERIYSLLIERSALPRIDKEGDVDLGGAWSSDPEHVRSIKRRRGELAKHLKDIRAGKKKPTQKTDDTRKVNKFGEVEVNPARSGPGGEGGRRTHAQAAGDIKSDLMHSRGREADDARSGYERRIAAREKQASRLSQRGK